MTVKDDVIILRGNLEVPILVLLWTWILELPNISVAGNPCILGNPNRNSSKFIFYSSK